MAPYKMTAASHLVCFARKIATMANASHWHRPGMAAGNDLKQPAKRPEYSGIVAATGTSYTPSREREAPDQYFSCSNTRKQSIIHQK